MDANTNETQLRKLRLAAVSALVIIAAALAVRGVIRSDRTKIEMKSSLPESSSQYIEPSEIEKIDKAAVIAQFTYGEVSQGSADDMLFAHEYAAPKRCLQPVYNAVFSPDGLQVASLEDTKLLCAAEVVYPLSQMLTGFYQETGMRTVMVSSAYEEPPQNSIAYNDYGEYSYSEATPTAESSGLVIGFSLYEEYKGSREFTGKGVYDWFTENCYKYGFMLYSPEGKESITGRDADLTRFRYVGKEAAYILHENGACFEELESCISQLSFDTAEIVEVNGRAVMVYAIAADENGSAQIRLPADPEGNPAPFTAYTCGGHYLICAELQYTPLIERAATDTASDTSTTADVNTED